MLGYGVFVLVAHVAFWPLLAYGWFVGELTGRRTLIFVALWLAAFAAGRLVSPFAFTGGLALIDILLVLALFKGDVTLY